jgi:hypothetical protein
LSTFVDVDLRDWKREGEEMGRNMMKKIEEE